MKKTKKKQDYGQFRAARHWSNRELRKIAPLFEGEIVNVSAGENKDKDGSTYDTYFTHKNAFHITNFCPGSFRGYQGREGEHLLDLSEPLPEELEAKFDVVMNHTVLEHVYDVRLAVKSICGMSRDVVISIVPFAQMQHDVEDFKDYWRICPSGLRQLYQENGFTVTYEAVDHEPDVGVYFMAVASKHPEKWQMKMPAYEPVQNAGEWIGLDRTPLTYLRQWWKKRRAN